MMKTPAILIIFLLATLSFVACGSSDVAADQAAIEKVIRGYVSSYNASNFDETLTYFTGFADRQDALSYLAFLRSQSGELTLVNFDPEGIAVEGSTAKVPAEFRIMGEVGFQWIHLKKEEGNWKILWEQENLPGSGGFS